MSKELFNQDLIESPNLPDDDLRVSFGKPGVAGGLNMLWAYFKQILQGSIAWLDFIPQDPVPSYLIGRIFYDDTENTWTAYNDIEGISLQIGEELRARLVNDTGGDLLDGKAVSVIGAVGASLQVELMDVSDFDSSIRGFGLMTHTVVNGQPGYAVRYGAVNDINTATLAVGQIVYGDPENPGELTTTRPKAPNYPVRIGICINSDAINGVIGVDNLAFNGTDTLVNIEGTLNGIVVETPAVEFYESGGTIYVEVTNQNEPTKNLTFLLDSVRYQLNTTSGGGPNNGAFAALVAGADAETLFENFVYIWLNGSTPELKVSTLATPDVLAPIGKASLFNVTRTLADGFVPFWRRYNDAPDNAADDGFNRWMADISRDKLGTTYTSGIDATVIVNSTPSVTIVTTTGVAMQAHKGSFTLQDGTSYLIYNDNTNAATYEEASDLASIIETALGVSLAVNGAYYRLPVYGVQNSESGGALAVPDSLLVTRPLNFYASAAEALVDASNFDIKPNDIITEGILFPLYTIIIGRTGGGGATWTEITTLDNRTRLIGGTGGGGASSGGGLDDKVRASAADTTNSYLTDKISVTGALKTIINPGGNEVLDFKVNTIYTPDGTAGVVYTDNAGNVGVEKSTLEAWSSNFTAIEVGGQFAVMGRTVEQAGASGNILQNVYYDGAYKYINTDEASRYQMFSGEHQFFVAASGTEDTEITWIEAMNIAVDGKVTGVSTFTGTDFILS